MGTVDGDIFVVSLEASNFSSVLKVFEVPREEVRVEDAPGDLDSLPWDEELRPVSSRVIRTPLDPCYRGELAVVGLGGSLMITAYGRCADCPSETWRFDVRSRRWTLAAVENDTATKKSKEFK